MSVSSELLFRVLGPLDVAGEHQIPPGRHQIVLACLLLEANRVVGIDTLVDAIWHDDPPATARTQVQICVSGLRAGLAGIDGVSIVTRAPGYLMRVPAGRLDAELFAVRLAEAETLVRDCRAEEAADCLRDAVQLWRGPALSGTASRKLQARALQLDEQRLIAVETLAEVDLRLGRHHQVISDIRGMVEEQPLRERLRGQLMLALYRAGRQAEALQIYRIGRELLVEQLGLEPSAELRQLQRAILAADESLRGADKDQQAESESGPFQLPSDIADFTGRDALVECVEGQLASTGQQSAVPVVMLVGKPGVGKSALAVHIGHRLMAEHFPNGQLYADLGGTRSQVVDAADVLGRFLRAFGIPGASIPDGMDERAEMYRNLLHRKRVLVVLDDAESERQLRPLLPGNNSCAVIVTSRVRLTGLPGARLLDVAVMESAQALELLRRVVGDERVDAEPAAADALVRLVGGLPLALRIVAARLAGRPHWTLPMMYDRLADERHRLDELVHGEMMVRASLALTYDGLTPAAGELFRLLAGVEAAGLPAWTSAALLDGNLHQATDQLELLVDAQMLEIASIDLDGSPRYKFHDVIRLFAREQLAANVSGAQREVALARVLYGWLALVSEAHRRIYGGDFTVLHGAQPAWRPVQSYVDRVLADPLRWLEAERANLCAAVEQAADLGLDELCWDLATTLVVLFESRCYSQDWERTHLRAMEATRAVGNRRGTAALMCSLSSLYLSRPLASGATELLLPALAVFEELDDAGGRALARRNLALYHHIRGETAAADALFRQALTDFTLVGDPIGQAHVLSWIGALELDAGALDDADEHLRAALTLCAGVGNRRVEVQVRFKQCELAMAQGQYPAAEEILAELLELVRATHDVVGEGRILHRLGLAHAGVGRTVEARECLLAAIAVREQAMDPTGAARVAEDLARLAIEETVGGAAVATVPTGLGRSAQPRRH
ncbi:MAG TPA: BTAD domain-containing putative transcriptional regulator [Pseudonocardiaceae bacterium]|jgi:DNA-binding SARP family transcriptional activator|nr:BTAD domain-containing putative transcriptional regulator [Pseudonocardiaceae bacterium]